MTSRLDCACGVVLIGTPTALQRTWSAQHTGARHRIVRLAPITAAAAARLVRHGPR